MTTELATPGYLSRDEFVNTIPSLSWSAAILLFMVVSYWW